MDTESPIVSARGLTRRFGVRAAVDAVDLDVRRGESLAVFGPNGAGKTTLLRLLAGALKATAGTLRVDGRDPAREDLEVRATLGLLSHQSFLYDDLSARDNLLFFARLHGVGAPRERADGLLDTVGLASRADDPVRTFSRGMQQRLSLARALVHDPLLLLLDEPFSGLDPHAARTLRETLQGLRRAGRTLIHTTHDPSEGLHLSDRWIFLARGRITASGASEGEDPARLERAYGGGA